VAPPRPATDPRPADSHRPHINRTRFKHAQLLQPGSRSFSSPHVPLLVRRPPGEGGPHRAEQPGAARALRHEAQAEPRRGVEGAHLGHRWTRAPLPFRAIVCCRRSRDCQYQVVGGAKSQRRPPPGMDQRPTTLVEVCAHLEDFGIGGDLGAPASPPARPPSSSTHACVRSWPCRSKSSARDRLVLLSSLRVGARGRCIPKRTKHSRIRATWQIPRIRIILQPSTNGSAVGPSASAVEDPPALRRAEVPAGAGCGHVRRALDEGRAVI
jgi:hypothetical protein